jgi:6-phosphogluconolactonase (cycloisomerase 2 family)
VRGAAKRRDACEAGSAATGAAPKGVAVARDGRHLFVANAGDGTISIYRIGDGALASVATQDAAGAVDVATERAVRDDMVAQAWVTEGDGPDRVVMCAPA